jgi:hypothetical protein
MTVHYPSGAPDVKKKLQFVEELTPGTLPLNDGAGTPGPITFKTCGFLQSVGKEIANDSNKIQPLGEYDIKSQVLMGRTYSSEVKFTPTDFKFMRYAMMLPIPATTTPPDAKMIAPNGTPGVTLSMYMTALVDGVEQNRVYKGTGFNSLACEITRDGGVNVTMPFEAMDITPWSSTPPSFLAGITYAADLNAEDMWSGITSGADPLDIDGKKVDTTSFSFNVDLNVNRFKPNGVISNKYSKVFGRKIDIKFNALVLDNDLVGDLTTYAPIDVTYNITPTYSIKFKDVKFDTYSAPIEGGSNDFWMEEFAGTSQGGIELTEPA